MFQSKDALIISILTVIMVMAWIAFDVYHAVSTSTITEVESTLITPLNPKIDQNLLDQILQRQLP